MNGALPEPVALGELLDRARAGDVEARATLVRLFSPHVRRAVRRHLNQQFRRIYEAIELAGDLWASFFTHTLPGKDFRTPGELVQFLAGAARRQTFQRYRLQAETNRPS
jgi:hypothetical protein